MKIKTQDLIGPALDWAVATAQDPDYWHPVTGPGLHAYSTDWSQGGPIIDRDGITVGPWITSPFMAHRGVHMTVNNSNMRFVGTSPLIAAMRCFVASKLGDEVDVPGELCV